MTETSETKGRILILAGGTGGHVMPAIAVAQAFEQKGYTVEWLGTRHGLENQLLEGTSYTLHTLPIRASSGSGPLGKIQHGLRLLWCFLLALRLMAPRRYKVVIGMGGYPSVPGGLAAWLLHRPLVIHEQNAIPGRANRLLSHFSRKRLSAYEDVFPLKKGDRITGNPLRSDFANLSHPEKRFTIRKRPLNILVIGGSQGAKILNEYLPAVIRRFPIERRPRVWHQTGQAFVHEVKSAYAVGNVDAQVSAFVDPISEAYVWADLVIARSGAMTLAELTASGTPSLLVPYPYAKDNHQYFNAMKLVSVGAAWMIEESQLTPDALYVALERAYDSPDRLIEMAQMAHRLAKPEATEHVVSACLETLDV